MNCKATIFRASQFIKKKNISFSLKYGDNRLNGSKVIALLLFEDGGRSHLDNDPWNSFNIVLSYKKQTIYFEPSNVKIGSGFWALQVRKNKVEKEREEKENKNLGGHFYTSLGEHGVEWSLLNFAHVFMYVT